jgi:hypothetical protein
MVVRTRSAVKKQRDGKTKFGEVLEKHILGRRTYVDGKPKPR